MGVLRVASMLAASLTLYPYKSENYCVRWQGSLTRRYSWIFHERPCTQQSHALPWPPQTTTLHSVCYGFVYNSEKPPGTYSIFTPSVRSPSRYFPRPRYG